MDNYYAPIVLFVYNRTWHTQQTIEALQKNKLVDQSDLIIYSDGAKNQSAQKDVESVRRYIKTVNGFKTIKIIERDKNWGLADSIVDGVTDVVNKYDTVIVLEDDMVTSPFFLKYMNDALVFYKEEKKVMHISGYMVSINPINLPETFFYRQMSCWGWATWKDSWRHFDRDIEKIYHDVSIIDIYNFNLDGCYDLWAQLEANIKGQIKTWAIFWYISIFKNRGLVLYPAMSMINNIGHDGSGKNSDSTSSFETKLAEKEIESFFSTVVENKKALSRIKDFYTNLVPTFRGQCVNKLIIITKSIYYFTKK